MQPLLRGHLEQAASENGRSLNAEIIARLEDSLQGKGASESMSGGIEALVSVVERKEAVIEAQSRLLSMCAVFLRLVNERIPPTGDAMSDRLTKLTKQFSDAMMHGDLKSAQAPIVEMVGLGTQLGILDENGKLKPEHEHLRSSPTKSKK